MTNSPTDDTTPAPRTFLDVLDELANLTHETGIQPQSASLGPDLGLHMTLRTDTDLRAWADHLHATVRFADGVHPPKRAFSVTLPDGVHVYAQSAEPAELPAPPVEQVGEVTP